MRSKFRLENLQTRLLHPINLTLEANKTLAVHGASGAGKTLFLRAICDLDQNSGEAYLNDVPRSKLSPTEWRKKVGYLPAESYWWSERVGAHAEHWDEQLLQQLGFSPGVLNWQTSRLSSGERQRLSLVRLLANQPQVLLLDEPTANLDQENTLHMESVVREYREATHACVIWVSHSAEQRRRLDGRTALIEDGRLSVEEVD